MRLAVFRGGALHDFPEGLQVAGVIRKPHVAGDFAQGHVGDQAFAAAKHPPDQDVFINAVTCLPLEFMGQVGLAHADGVCQRGAGHVFPVMLMDVFEGGIDQRVGAGRQEAAVICLHGVVGNEQKLQQIRVISHQLFRRLFFPAAVNALDKRLTGFHIFRGHVELAQPGGAGLREEVDKGQRPHAELVDQLGVKVDDHSFVYALLAAGHAVNLEGREDEQVVFLQGEDMVVDKEAFCAADE